ncbi:hypothetical protein PF005_g569 [Phytophthora fragariae]|uniref:Uncharacterized protein n=1 Tax=Phytophthora fragariae TaxID=53985 RepID=A0A6A4ALE9_9STRA|nr:hypothetical protein PF003_g5494 [Phytophthora fragariae]KAE8949696.1 hypothetical protein PF009_g740 [Phytophthora fragariae]KAE9030860.1 hypothetical protein PF011_g391 [Phytophthora fragariae]KAE9139611.1 hypothetical protein PF010_g528 [Phytophthora fragariae]KAE9140568.1 hypothetical protein PF007_g622 [Phytophthora fragariae]
MTEAVVGRFKAELKRSLRSHVAQAVNDVCGSFAEELKPPEPSPPAIRPQVGASAYETDYDCCRQLVEYIERNMDTSPGFTQQMDCIILAFQSNASIEVLNSVVKQNLWFRRKYVGDKAAETLMKTAEVRPNGGKKLGNSSNGKQRAGAMNSKGRKAVSEVEKAKQEVPLEDVRVESDGAGVSKSADSRLKDTPVEVVSSKLDAIGSGAGETQPALDGAVTAKVDSTTSGILVQGGGKAPHTALDQTKASQVTESQRTDKKGSKGAEVNASGSTVSLPREWGKRKRLVTRKRPKTAESHSKRARREVPPPDQSSTESDNPDGDDHQTASPARGHDAKSKKAELHMSASATQESAVGAVLQKTTCGNVSTVTAASATTCSQFAAQETNAGAQQQLSRKMPLVKNTGSNPDKAAQKATVNVAVPVSKGSVSSATEEEKSDEEDKPDARPSAESEEKSRRCGDKTLFDVDLRKVAQDLEAGDEVYGLQVAKVRFQSMLDSLVETYTKDPDTSASKAVDKSRTAADPIAKFCAIEQWSFEQRNEFNTRLRGTIEIVDASLCKPPPGYYCCRGCKTIRAQMCNKSTPCINPICHAWHDAETHSESCVNEKCEFNTRVRLRETMHRIEQKQQQITSASDALKHAKAELLSPTRRSNQERVSVGNAKTFERIESLEHNLENLNGELLIQLDEKLQYWATLSSIGIDTQSDKIDGVPDFASHYATRSHQRKKQ